MKIQNVAIAYKRKMMILTVSAPQHADKKFAAVETSLHPNLDAYPTLAFFVKMSAKDELYFELLKRPGSDSRGLKGHYKIRGGRTRLPKFKLSANFTIGSHWILSFSNYMAIRMLLTGGIFGVLPPGVFRPLLTRFPYSKGSQFSKFYHF